jgi:hypothetical protein
MEIPAGGACCWWPDYLLDSWASTLLILWVVLSAATALLHFA